MILYAKLGGIALILALTFWAGWHLGGLSNLDKLDATEEHSADLTVKALQRNALAEAKQVITDTQADAAHEKTLADLSSIAPDTHPLIVYRAGPACAASAVPRTQTEAGGHAADPRTGGDEPGGGTDIRPDVEALKKRLEILMADYRRLDAEWPTQ